LVAGAAFFGGVLYWISSFGFLAWSVLVALMAASWLLFGWFGAWASHRVVWRLLGLPFLFAAAEILRSRWPLGGFAWGLLGTTQHSGLPLLPVARIGGVFLLGAAVMLINVAIAEVLVSRRMWKRAAALTLGAGMAAGAAFIPYGAPGPASGVLDVAALQVNVREGTFGPHRGRRIGPEDLNILDGFVGLSRDLAASPPDLVIWPENALDRDPFDDAALMTQVSAVVQEVGRPFLIGAILDAPGGRFRNALLHVESDGTVARIYDKQHLVPFGEYVPWTSLRRIIPALEQVPFDGRPGKESVVFDVRSSRVGGVVCFESIFPDLVRSFVNNGAQMLVVATNNASFGRSMVSREHLAQSQLRAVEEGRVVVHAAISGISAVVSPRGVVSHQTALFSDAVVRANVPLYDTRTPYARFGDAIELGIAALGAVVALAGLGGAIARRRERREQRAAGEFDWGPPTERQAILEQPTETP
jgi:apolipoprotein N-acyltransferase